MSGDSTKDKVSNASQKLSHFERQSQLPFIQKRAEKTNNAYEKSKMLPLCKEEK